MTVNFLTMRPEMNESGRHFMGIRNGCLDNKHKPEVTGIRI